MDASEIGTLEFELWQLAQADPDAFVSAVAAATLPHGGWAVYGAAQMVVSVLGRPPEHPSFDELQAASLDFLRSCGVPSTYLNQYERDFWIRHRGSIEEWGVADAR